MGKSGWAAAEEAAEKAQSGTFVRLQNDGDKVTVFFIGDPYTIEVFWDGSGYIPYSKEHEAQGKTPSYKYKFNVFVPADKAVKVYECGVAAFKDILACKKKYGLDKKTFEIVRKGKKNDTKTTYSVLPDADLTAEQRAIMDKLPLHDLEKTKDDEEGKSDANGKGEFSTFKGKDGVVDAKVAEAFMGRLKILPREQINKFLARFGVEKIKQVKADDADLADKFILFLEGKGPNPDEKPAPPAPAEKDPFAD